MTIYEARAAASILADAYGDAEVRMSSGFGLSILSDTDRYFVRVYPLEGQTFDVNTVSDAGLAVQRMAVKKIKRNSKEGEQAHV
jgi:hypothetical protein